VLAAAALSGAIELCQLVLPGRDASAGDVIANAAGGMLGMWLAGAPARLLLRPSEREAVILSFGWSGVVGALTLLAGYLLQPSFPDTVYWGQWTPNLGHLEWYRGQVLRAEIGGIPLPSRRLDSSETVRGKLREGSTLTVHALAGPTTTRLGSLFSIYDESQQEILLIGPVASDLVVRARTVAAAIGLETPCLQFRDLMMGLDPGDTLSIGLETSARGRYRLAVNDRERVEQFSIASLWSLLLASPTSPGTRALAGLLWACTLAAPAGWWLRARIPLGLAAFAAAVLAIVVLSRSLGQPPEASWTAAFLASALFVAAARARWRPSREFAAARRSEQ
jgi:hypothetical protein